MGETGLLQQILRKHFKKDNIQQHQIIKMFYLKIKGMIFKQTFNPRIYKGRIDGDSYYYTM